MRTQRTPLTAATLAAIILVLGPDTASAGFHCTMTLRLPDPVTLGALVWNTGYAGAPGYFPGTSGGVECTGLLPPAGLAAFNDRDAERILTSGLIAVDGFTGPLNVAECTFAAAVLPASSDFAISVTQANGTNGMPVPLPLVDIAALACDGVDSCGDGVVGDGEECEDGNSVQGDCCTPACQLDIDGAPCNSDGDVCTDDVCDGAGACEHPQNTAPCDDGQFCTDSDTCSAGTCAGVTRDCGDDDTCTADSCNETDDACVHTDVLSCLVPQRKCMGLKLKAVAKLQNQLLACQAKVAAANDASDLAACENKARGKFAIAFSKAGTCRGDELRCANIAGDCEYGVAAAMIDDFQTRCEAAKRRAAGKLARAELNCYARAATKGEPLDAECITKAQGKFGVSLAKAGVCPDGGSPQLLVEHVCVEPSGSVSAGDLVLNVCPVPPPTTTTTTTSTSTTYETSTTTNWVTTTTGSTPTTTLDLPLRCTLTFRVIDEVPMAFLQWDTDYSAAPGFFPGEAAMVECIGLIPESLLAFNDQNAQQILVSGLININGFMGPVDLTQCTFAAAVVPTGGDFVITIVDATDADGVPVSPTPTIAVAAIDCVAALSAVEATP